MQKLLTCLFVSGKFIEYYTGNKGLKRRNPQPTTCSFEYGAIMETTFLLKLWASQVEFCLIPLPSLNFFWAISSSYPHLYIYKI